MIERLWVWWNGRREDRRQAQAARDALCQHDGEDPMCRDCYDAHMSTI